MKKAIRENQRCEAVVRMRLLGATPDDIQRLLSGDIPLYDGAKEPHVRLSARQQGIAKAIESKYGVFVFAVVHDDSDKRSENDSYLFVSKAKGDWLLQREDAQNGLAVAYTHSITSPDLSELGTIALFWNKVSGTLIRTA